MASKKLVEPKEEVKKVKAEAVKAVKTVKPAAEVKVEVKVEAKASKTVKKVEKKSSLTIDVYGIDGKVVETISLPVEVFGEKVNKTLLAQAVRVYLANKRQGTASTKTRGEVDGSTRKIYRQKGTGRARHGSVRAPIFVHGGVVFGPKPKDYSLKMPQKMRRKALFNALSGKLQDGELKVIAGLEGIAPKTKEFASVLKHLGIENNKQKLLFVMPSDLATVKRAGRNVPGVAFTAVKRLNALDVLNNKQLILMKDVVEELKKSFVEEK